MFMQQYQQPQYQPQYSQAQYQPPRKPVGAWYFAHDFAEIQNAQLPIDGTPTIFMLENAQVFYVCSLQNGHKIAQGYSFAALKPVAEKEPEDDMTKIMSRLDGITTMLEAHDKVLQELGGTEK